MVSVRSHPRRGTRGVRAHVRHLPADRYAVSTTAQVLKLIRVGDFGVLSAATPGMSNQEQYEAQERLRIELIHLGYAPLTAVGSYVYESGPLKGQKANEFSLFVPGLGRTDALRLGRKYGQESVLVQGVLRGARADNWSDPIMTFDPNNTIYGGRALSEPYHTIVYPIGAGGAAVIFSLNP